MNAKEHIEQIRASVDALEVTVASAENAAEVRNWDALELPSVICSVVDYLQPQLTTYEAVLYWHLLRHSLLGNGTQHVRVSVRGLQTKVAISSSGKSDHFSYKVIQKSFATMEEKGVIERSGDTTRAGSLCKVLLPDEIAMCAEYRSQELVAHVPIDVKSATGLLQRTRQSTQGIRT